MKRTTAAGMTLGLIAMMGWGVVACQSSRAPAPDSSSAPAGTAAAPAPVATPTPAPAPAPAAPVVAADATITNAPSLAGTVVLDLPPLPTGTTRTVVDGDGAFVINADGDLERGFTALVEPGRRQVVVRDAPAAGTASERKLSIAVQTAPWTIDAFPEMLVLSLTQEGAGPTGPLAQVPFGGFAGGGPTGTGRTPSATATDGRVPLKLAANAGISFPAGKGSALAFKSESEALQLYRWSLVVFRVEPDGAGKIATLLSVNDGPQPNGRSGNWIPRLQLDAAERAVTATYRGTALHRLRSPAGSVAVDGKWNVALTYRRNGRLFLRVNGADCGQDSPTDSFSAERPDDMVGSRIGDATMDAAGWALDGLWLGQSELSERTVAKMESWALGRAAKLPNGAAASPAVAPVIDSEDFPHRYVFDPPRFQAWKAANGKAQRLAFQGRKAAEVQPDRSSWVRVFVDDFRKPAKPGARALGGSSVGDSTADVDAGRQAWYAPGINSAVGGKAICKDGNDRPFPEVYVLDPAAQTLTMRLYCAAPGQAPKPNRWRSSQISSVNDSGQGYAWGGLKGFRVRAKLGNSGALFPCPIWFYGQEHLFWRTGERIEFDIIEIDKDWDNYGATHVHNGQFKGLFGHSAIDTMKKSVPEELRSLKLAAGKQVCGVNAWDGKFHTWEVWIEDDLTYINVDGLEVTRVTTAPEYRERLFMYIDTCLKEEQGMDEKKSYDMTLDSVETFMPASQVDATPGKPFTARPALTGNGEPGATITCAANLAGCSDVWYYWHVDGYPRGFGTANTYTVLPEDRGAQVRCMVKAVGAKNQDEAWTAPVSIR